MAGAKASSGPAPTSSAAGAGSVAQSSLSSRSLAQRGSGARFVRMVGVDLVEVLPAHRAQARALCAAEDLLAAQREHEAVPGPPAQVEHLVLDVGALELLAAPGSVDLADIYEELGRGRLEAAHARSFERGGEAKPQRVAAAGHARDVEGHVGTGRRHRVALAPEAKLAHGDLELDPPPLSPAQPEPAEIEAVGARSHAVEVSGRSRDPGSTRPRSFQEAASHSLR